VKVELENNCDAVSQQLQRCPSLQWHAGQISVRGDAKIVEMALASQANPGTKTSATVLRIEEIHPTKATSPFSFSAEEVSRTGGLIGNYPAALRGVFNRNVFTSKSCDYPL